MTLDDLFGRPSAPAGPPRITFLCTGNICRSPLAEKILRARLADLGDTHAVVSSAGLHAVVGAPMEAQPAEIATRYGADPQHTAAQATADVLRSSSLVLTMTREQRAEVSREYPFALKRSFTLIEFVRILDELPSEVRRPSLQEEGGLFDTVMEASRFRGMIALGDEDDIDDPYRRSAETHERVGTRIAEVTARLAAQLTDSRGEFS
ncbi:arsenate reductase/protein-tyrosine-phosphatase family protein [Herbiconiux sp. YIM B11900]|uniref:arsenate reductase/protein-tyrosine-phosphatase family protein n=1 Tax=Herbiconiux sp. YIM B11900 TaxID=3404131 RepID=UPI003F8541FD